MAKQLGSQLFVESKPGPLTNCSPQPLPLYFNKDAFFIWGNPEHSQNRAPHNHKRCVSARARSLRQRTELLFGGLEAFRVYLVKARALQFTDRPDYNALRRVHRGLHACARESGSHMCARAGRGLHGELWGGSCMSLCWVLCWGHEHFSCASRDCL